MAGRRGPDLELGGAGARYGMALGNPGDLTGDGCEEVLVGAPGQDDAAGVVYLYTGAKAGPGTQPAQIIQAKVTIIFSPLKNSCVT